MEEREASARAGVADDGADAGVGAYGVGESEGVLRAAEGMGTRAVEGVLRAVESGAVKGGG